MSRYIHNFTCVLLYICRMYVHCYQTTYRHLWKWHTFYDHHDCFLALVIVVLNITVPLLLSLYSWYIILMRCKSSIFFFLHHCVVYPHLYKYIYIYMQHTAIHMPPKCHQPWHVNFEATTEIEDDIGLATIGREALLQQIQSPKWKPSQWLFLFLKSNSYRLLPWFWIEHCNP